MQSGKPVGVFKTHAGAPRVLIANANLVPNWATWETFRDLEDRGLTMYGQMTAGSWIYIGSQGILQGTYETLAEVARRHFNGTLSGKIVVTAGLGGMGGAQPLAVTMNGGVALVVEVDPPRIEKRLATQLPGREHRRRRRGDRHARGATRGDGVARSIGLLGNAADVLPALVARGFTPDVVTDQTSAHDPLVGYVPDGLSLADAARLRDADPDEYQRAVDRSDGPARRGDARAAEARRDHVRLRQQHPRAGGEGRRRPTRSRFPASCRNTSGRCSAKARVRSAGSALSGDPEDIRVTDRAALELFPDDDALCRWIQLAGERVQFQGLPARICWLGYGDRARFGLRLNELVRDGAVKAPIVIGRDHLDTGSVASPNRETEGMRDGSDAIADWPILNALLNASAGATWVSVHHGGGVGIGYSIHAGMVIVADGTREADERLARVLTCDPGIGRGAARRCWLSRSAAAPHVNTEYGSPCRRRADDGSPRRPRTPRARRARRHAGAHPGRDRRLRHRPHHAAARAGRSHGPRPMPVHRRRARRAARPSASTRRWPPRRRSR